MSACGVNQLGVIQGTGHNAHAARRCGRPTEQPGATIRTEAATDNAAAIADDFVVFNLAGNLNRANRDKNRRGKCAAVARWQSRQWQFP